VEDRITVDPNICHGEPVVSGTRVPVAIIVGSLRGGMTREQVMREYRIDDADIVACLAFVKN